MAEGGEVTDALGAGVSRTTIEWGVERGRPILRGVAPAHPGGSGQLGYLLRSRYFEEDKLVLAVVAGLGGGGGHSRGGGGGSPGRGPSPGGPMGRIRRMVETNLVATFEKQRHTHKVVQQCLPPAKRKREEGVGWGVGGGRHRQLLVYDAVGAKVGVSWGRRRESSSSKRVVHDGIMVATAHHSTVTECITLRCSSSARGLPSPRHITRILARR